MAGSQETKALFEHEFNEIVYHECIDHQTSDFHLSVTERGSGQRLKVISYTRHPVDGLCKAGAFIQRLDADCFSSIPFTSNAEPVVSCIILLTFNCFFVRNFLIPSIVANTNVPFEIIIVYNGVATDLDDFRECKVITSEIGCVSKGYNAGVDAASGEYIAIFHDDCLITTRGWHEQMMEALKAGAFAVSTESVYNPHFKLQFLKGTPLFMSRANYALSGGHDEFYFAGIEDLDFSYCIQAGGYSIKEVAMPYRHFNGMSTVILLSGHPQLTRTLFGYCLIPDYTIQKWKTDCMSSPETQSMMHAVNNENISYFLNKMSSPYDTKAVSGSQYPALLNIRNTYQRWLQKQFQ